MQELLVALALVFIIEGMLPFLSPGNWRRFVAGVASLDDRTVRRAGLVSMAIGTLILLWLK